jgi:hypothetical protein
METPMKKRSARSIPARPGKDPSPYPKGWNRKRVQALIDYYDKQSDDEAVAEAEAAYKKITTTMMPIPVELVPKVQKLIAKRAG